MTSTSSTGWSYDPTLFSTSTATGPTMICRRLIGDVLASDQQLQDGEINFAIGQYSNIYLAAAECSRWISSQYSRKVDLVTGTLKTNYSEAAKAYTLRAKELEARGMARGGAMPYCGGISLADKRAQEADTDRVPPQFKLGLEDNVLNPAGNAPQVDIDAGGNTGNGSGT